MFYFAVFIVYYSGFFGVLYHTRSDSKLKDNTSKVSIFVNSRIIYEQATTRTLFLKYLSISS